MTLAEMLKKIKDNPEDLTELPTIIEKVGELETEYSGSIDKIGQLQELNRKYLSMIPIKDETEEEETEEEEPPSIEDAIKGILEKE